MPYIDRWMKRPMKTTTKCSYHQMTAIFAFVSGILFCLPTIASLISTKHITCQLYLPHQPQVIRIEPYNTWIMNADRYNQNPLIKKKRSYSDYVDDLAVTQLILSLVAILLLLCRCLKQSLKQVHSYFL